MLDWLKTAQGMLAAIATALAIVATCWQRRLLLYLYGPDAAAVGRRGHAREQHLGLQEAGGEPPPLAGSGVLICLMA
jgi:hypothetical protein